MKPYILKRLDDEIAILNITENGLIEDYKLFNNNAHLAPLHEPNSTDWLKKWWARRAVPFRRWQKGEDIKAITYSFHSKNIPSHLGDIFA